MDENQYEQAEKLQQAQIDAGISRIQRYEGESLSECAECGDEIPEGRRVAVPGVQHCVQCAEHLSVKKNGVRRV